MVLEKYKVENIKRKAYRGRGVPLEWRPVRRSEKHKIRKCREDCWARISALFRERSSAQDFEACSMERSSEDLEERRRGCKVAET